MSGESTQRQNVIRALAQLHAFSVENLVNPGTPDLFFIGGCLELKCIKEWPARATTVIKKGVAPGKDGKKGFSTQQRLFCRTWARKHGFHSICLQVARDWFLIEPVQAATHLGIDWTHEDIWKNAWWHTTRFDAEEFLSVIRIGSALSQEAWNSRMKK